jgi:predicted SnoaL-like aldol condensation-catalyzing enzyme
MAGGDIWRFNDDGKMIERWDVLQEVPETTAARCADRVSCRLGHRLQAA